MASAASHSSKAAPVGWFRERAKPTSGSVASALSRLGRDAVLDGEIASVDSEGVTQLTDLMFAQAPAHFFAFDVLFLDGEDLRDRPCIERKQVLETLIQDGASRLHYVDHIEEDGEDLFCLICERDMEGIVAKPRSSPYRDVDGETPTIKIKNPDYSQAEDRGELFQQEG